MMTRAAHRAAAVPCESCRPRMMQRPHCSDAAVQRPQIGSASSPPRLREQSSAQINRLYIIPHCVSYPPFSPTHWAVPDSCSVGNRVSELTSFGQVLGGGVSNSSAASVTPWT
jgi:hypothetical protein